MSEWLKSLVLRLIRVPPEPHPPVGGEGSIRIFRASRRFYQLNLARWGLRQAFVLAGILLAFATLGAAEFGSDKLRQLADSPRVEDEASRRGLHRAVKQLAAGDFFLRENQVFALIHLLETLGLLLFVVQLPVTCMLVRLDYELRWYIVTDRSLRIREGIFRINELTLTFANVQDVSIRQNPVQRLLGICDLRVQTAGGGGGGRASGPGRHRRKESGHVGYFHGLDDAEAIRDLILDRLRLLRGDGLGEPEGTISAPAPDASATPRVLAAAHEILAEVQALAANIRPADS